MMVSIVNDSQSHLNTRVTTSGGGTAASIRGMDRSRAGSNTTQYSRFNTGWGKTEQLKSSANAVARQTRAMDTQVQNIAHQIRRMATDIRAFRKNFPPFPRGSEERERLLNSFQGIRKQIERLTLPPKKDAAHSLQGDDGSQAGSSSTLIERFESLLQTIGARLPEMPAGRSDADFQKLEEHLETLLEFISQERAELVEPGKYYDSGSDSEFAVPLASFSLTLGQTFAEQRDWQMTVSQTRLKALQV